MRARNPFPTVALSLSKSRQLFMSSTGQAEAERQETEDLIGSSAVDLIKSHSLSLHASIFWGEGDLPSSWSGYHNDYFN